MSHTVGDVMTRRVFTVDPKMTLTDLDRVLLEHGVSGAPVVEGGRLVGVVSQADVVRVLHEEQVHAQRVSAFYGSPFPISMRTLQFLGPDSRKIAERMTKLRVAEVMTPAPITTAATATIEDAAKLMFDEGIHRLPVVENEELVGILSALDLVELVAKGGLAK